MDTEQKQENSPLATAPKRSKFWKFAAWFVIVIVGAVVLLWGIGWYEQWKGERDVEKMAEAFKKAEEESYARAMSDTYGGKTPQETLKMYIDAVEKGDYELASKCLVESRREADIAELRALDAKNSLTVFVAILKDAEPEKQISDNDFRMKSKTQSGTYYFVTFTKYPNGIWKIIGI